MEIHLNQNVQDANDLIICNKDAEITINAEMVSTAKNIYIHGKKILILGKINAPNGEIMIKGPSSLRGSFPQGKRFIMGPCEDFPQYILDKGNYISPNLQKKITIIDAEKAA